MGIGWIICWCIIGFLWIVYITSGLFHLAIRKNLTKKIKEIGNERMFAYSKRFPNGWDLDIQADKKYKEIDEKYHTLRSKYNSWFISGIDWGKICVGLLAITTIAELVYAYYIRG